MSIEDSIRYPETGDYHLERDKKREFFGTSKKNPYPEGSDLAAGFDLKNLLNESEPKTPPWKGEKGKLLVENLVDYYVNPDKDIIKDPGGNFWFYRHGVWLRDDDELVRRLVKIMTNDIRPASLSTVEIYLRGTLESLNLDSVSDEYINFTNGMLRLADLVLLPHEKKYRSINQLTVPWTPNEECPNFDITFAQWNHPDAIDYGMQLGGYALTPGNKRQICIFVRGEGSNGKTVFFDVLRAIVGKDNYGAVSPEQMSKNRFIGASLYGKILNIVGDINPVYMEDTGYFKAMTGAEEIFAEKKNQHGFQFTPRCVSIFSGNKLPRSNDTSFGFDRRWGGMIEFPNQFEPDSDPDLWNRLKFELAAIASKLVKSYAAVKNQPFEYPPSAIAMKQEFSDTNDHVRIFKREYLRPCGKGEHPTPRTVVRARYEKWATAEGFTALKAAELYRRLGLEKITIDGYHYFKGTKLIADPSPITALQKGHSVTEGDEPHTASE